jgi:hypothetical protein
MEPLHTIEYEATSELATETHRAILRRELRLGWRREMRTFVAALVLTVIIVWLGASGWLMLGYAAGLLCLVVLCVIGALYRRWSRAGAASWTILMALQTSDRRVRIELTDNGIRLETEFFRGQGTWTELDEIVIFPGFWVLYLSNGGQVMLPASLVSPELETFLRAKAQLVAAPIRQG